MTQNDIGWAVYIDDQDPATINEAGFQALNWVRVAGLQSLGNFGLTHAGVDVPDLTEGFTTQVKGGGSGVDTSATFRDVTGDAGQALAKTIADSPDGTCSVKFIKLGPTKIPAAGDRVHYANGIMHSFMRREKSMTTHGGFSVVFRNNIAYIDSIESV